MGRNSDGGKGTVMSATDVEHDTESCGRSGSGKGEGEQHRNKFR